MAKKLARHKRQARSVKIRKTASRRGEKGDIRSYGPGKYDSIIDGYVHGLSLDSGDGLGDVEHFGYYSAVDLGRSVLHDIEKEAAESGDLLTTAEKNLIRGSAGAILEENSQGFVRVEYYPTKRALEKAWARIEKEYEKFEDEYGDND